MSDLKYKLFNLEEGDLEFINIQNYNRTELEYISISFTTIYYNNHVYFKYFRYKDVLAIQVDFTETILEDFDIHSFSRKYTDKTGNQEWFEYNKILHGFNDNFCEVLRAIAHICRRHEDDFYYLDNLEDDSLGS